MSDYIDIGALGQVLLVSLLTGAGLVAVFALGLVGWSEHVGRSRASAPSGGTSGSVPGLLLAGLCFTVVLGGTALGLWTILG